MGLVSVAIGRSGGPLVGELGEMSFAELVETSCWKRREVSDGMVLDPRLPEWLEWQALGQRLDVETVEGMEYVGDHVEVLVENRVSVTFELLAWEMSCWLTRETSRLPWRCAERGCGACSMEGELVEAWLYVVVKLVRWEGGFLYGGVERVYFGGLGEGMLLKECIECVRVGVDRVVGRYSDGVRDERETWDEVYDLVNGRGGTGGAWVCQGSFRGVFPCGKDYWWSGVSDAVLGEEDEIESSSPGLSPNYVGPTFSGTAPFLSPENNLTIAPEKALVENSLRPTAFGSDIISVHTRVLSEQSETLAQHSQSGLDDFLNYYTEPISTNNSNFADLWNGDNNTAWLSPYSSQTPSTHPLEPSPEVSSPSAVQNSIAPTPATFGRTGSRFSVISPPDSNSLRIDRITPRLVCPHCPEAFSRSPDLE
ncbi:hypothetical protein K458DRAFT_403338 [Lentithecium fluviatile CBS 122367]|uniref:Uncharacterized protein n=1 Tax=Lentithecium fluviatile CBS 122367 TaxID=1168545 RepID=A0A6G1J3W0_9PLEO|nr:hypothetical protein K458DRAFT_403338 [Lentithecium fluviatile CBS 122367]